VPRGSRSLLSRGKSGELLITFDASSSLVEEAEFQVFKPDLPEAVQVQDIGNGIGSGHR